MNLCQSSQLNKTKLWKSEWHGNDIIFLNDVKIRFSSREYVGAVKINYFVRKSKKLRLKNKIQTILLLKTFKTLKQTITMDTTGSIKCTIKCHFFVQIW